MLIQPLRAKEASEWALANDDEQVRRAASISPLLARETFSLQI